ncbi:MAG: HRDC domain-containing protein [Phycisphaerales bacterium]|jgi:superfamily II DNA helicase RecQ
MQFCFFAIPALDPQAAQQELNAFLATHRVVSVEWQWIDAGTDSAWGARVTVAAGPGPLPRSLKAERGVESDKPARIDYREILNEDDFKRFAELRLWRKGVAESEGVPVYAVFTNEQLAAIVTRRVADLSELAAIDGVGAARVERYGRRLLDHLHASGSHATPR